MRTFNKRERNLLWLLLGAIFVVTNVLAARFVSKRIRAAKAEVVNLELQTAANRALLFQRSEAEERQQILDDGLPVLESAGKAQGVMLEALQNEMRDRRFESQKQTLVEPKSTDYYDEVAVTVILKGDAAEIMKWLITLQQPNQFYVIKFLEVELDKKSQKKEPQALCNLTLARWFKPVSS